MAEPSVRIPGIVLASLMFQHVNSDSDVEGFILGESKVEEQITISDSQADHIHIEEVYNIQKHVACHKLNGFYDSLGDVDVDAVRNILADNKQENVIGWYRQRRNTEQQMTLRERTVHEKLKSALSNPHVIFVLLTSGQGTASGSTHRMEYAAFISRSRRFINVPVLVNNLGVLEQLAYWKVSSACSAAGYNLTVKKHGSKFFSSNGLLREVNEVNKMNDCLQTELQKACGEVEESERLVETLQAEVSALRRRLRERRRSGAGKASDEDPPEQKNNLLLHEAVRALFACSPLFHTQTLTLEGFPVRDVRCGVEQDGDVSAAAAGLAQRRRSGTARPAASLQEELWETAAREEKRRKTSS
ncbi:BRCA1-A complex subunit Abraxas 1 isoform X2 [Chelmon rostratus]|uniref:BRCA1-A complex subunit Abraxas 1 isoform X2 n=1 Tax=Chelmon rostratus TaxID=109905 RepID=UPI001BE86508|nr:BRCA1-A complex subunit Abraxas 1 isoform X2 [Chelmon rostratus]